MLLQDLTPSLPVLSPQESQEGAPVTSRFGRAAADEQGSLAMRLGPASTHLS